MIEKISDFFWRIANWKTFLLGLIVYLIFGGYVMPHGAKTFNDLSGKKVEVMDLQFFYTPEKAREIISQYSDAARNFAIQFGLMADTVYPVAYTFLFLIITTLIFKGLAKYNITYKYLHLFPLIILPVDYFENICVATLFKTYPNFSNGLAYLATFFTTLKWSLVILLLLIVIAGLITLAVKQFSKAN